MTKDELKRLMERHYIVEYELEYILDFVYDLLVRKAEILKDTEPYATVTIQSLYDAAHEVEDLEYDIQEIGV